MYKIKQKKTKNCLVFSTSTWTRSSSVALKDFASPLFLNDFSFEFFLIIKALGTMYTVPILIPSEASFVILGYQKKTW